MWAISIRMLIKFHNIQLTNDEYQQDTVTQSHSHNNCIKVVMVSCAEQWKSQLEWKMRHAPNRTNTKKTKNNEQQWKKYDIRTWIATLMSMLFSIWSRGHSHLLLLMLSLFSLRIHPPPYIEYYRHYRPERPSIRYEIYGSVICDLFGYSQYRPEYRRIIFWMEEYVSHRGRHLSIALFSFALGVCVCMAKNELEWNNKRH